MSGGKITNAATNPVIASVFASHQSGGNINIVGASVGSPVFEKDAIEGFCDDLYSSLRLEYSVAVSQSECISALQAADKNPVNARLNNAEFVAFVGALTAETFDSPTSFTGLPIRVQTTFRDFAIEGEVRSSAGMAFLVQFCERTSLDVQIELQKVVTIETTAPPPSPPTLAPTVSLQPPTQAPGPVLERISEDQFAQCRKALTVADASSKDEKLDKDEYVGFLSQMSPAGLAGTSYDTIHPLFASNYDTLQGDDDLIDIGGAKLGTEPTATQFGYLENVCAETIQTIQLVKLLAPAPTTAPPPTAPQPTAEDPAFTQCKSAMSQVDGNSDERLSQEEYVGFLNLVGDNAFDGKTFSELDPVLKESFYSLAGSQTESIVITGARSGDPDRREALEFVCQEADRALSKWKEEQENEPSNEPPSTPTPGDGTLEKSCLEPIMSADADADKVLSKTEYASFVNVLARRSGSLDFDELPYLLKENFEWIKIGRGSIDLSEIDSKSKEGIAYGRFICSRTRKIQESASSGEPAVTLVDQCSRSSSKSDTNDNDMLNESEYFMFVDEMSGFAFEGLEFDTLDTALQSVFADKKSPSTNEIDIAAAKLKEVPTAAQISALVSMCEHVEDVMNVERSNDAFFQQCRIALVANDEDSNAAIAKEEFVSVLFDLRGGSANGVTFDDLDDVLRISFDLLRERKETIDISGLDGAASTSQIDHARWICSKIGEVIDSVPGDDIKTSISVFNSFIITNTQGLGQGDLEFGQTRTSLENAYERFVAEEVRLIKLGSRNLRGLRRLEVLNVVEASVRLYRIDDRNCPGDVAAGSNCQTAYGSFELAIVNESSPDQISESYSNQLQSAISSGALQAQIVKEDPRFPVRVYGPSQSLRPGSSAQNGDDSGISVVLLAIILSLAAILLCVGSYFMCQRCSREKPEMSSKFSSNDMNGLHPEQAPSMTFLPSLNQSTHKAEVTNEPTSDSSHRAPPGRGRLSRTASRMHPEQRGSLLQRKTQSGRKLLGRMNSRRSLKAKRFDDTSSNYSDMIGKTSDHSRLSSNFCVDDDAGSYMRRDAHTSERDDTERFSRGGRSEKQDRLGTFNEVEEEDVDASAVSDDISWLEKSVAGSADNSTVASRRGVRRHTSTRSQRAERRPSRFPARPQAPSSSVPGKQRRRGRRSSHVDPTESLSRSSHSRGVSRQHSRRSTRERRAPQRTESEISQISMDESLHVEERKAQLARELAKSTEQQDTYDDELTLADEQHSYDDNYSHREDQKTAEQNETDEELTISGDSPRKRKPEPPSPESYRPEPPGVSEREERQRSFRSQLEKLVREVVPDELDNITTMMEQFEGNEDELLQTLENMREDEDDDNDSFANEEDSQVFEELEEEQSNGSDELSPSEEEDEEELLEKVANDQNVSVKEETVDENRMGKTPVDDVALTVTEEVVEQLNVGSNDESSYKSSSEESSEEEEEDDVDDGEDEDESVTITLEEGAESASSITDEGSSSYEEASASGTEESEVSEEEEEVSEASESESEESSSYETESEAEVSESDHEETVETGVEEDVVSEDEEVSVETEETADNFSMDAEAEVEEEEEVFVDEDEAEEESVIEEEILEEEVLEEEIEVETDDGEELSFDEEVETDDGEELSVEEEIEVETDDWIFDGEEEEQEEEEEEVEEESESVGEDDEVSASSASVSSSVASSATEDS